jgi:GT2 family glycosyltransferase
VGRGELDRPGLWWLRVKKSRRLIAGAIPVLRDYLNANVPRPPAWRGENSSTFAEDIRRVGGFDERFAYGYGDAEFGHRLQNAGVLPISIRYTAPVFHLEHRRPWARADLIEQNCKLLEETIATRKTFTEFGLPARAA